ncbi:MAG: hypothetical protein E7612_01750 [Ruminococcaceae bacterium]|nr:hypothetical protein [Oscillospiraceae bacterium]
MNYKRILSAALLVVMIFTSVFAAIPFTSYAAYSESSASASSKVPEGYTEANLNSAELEEYLKEIHGSNASFDENSDELISLLSYNFSSASAMLNYELKRGYLYYANSAGNDYSIFINKYTGFMYYVNNVTGQILTSNPISLNSAASAGDKEVLMSQIIIKYSELANTTVTRELNSMKWAARRSQIQVTSISNGLRVNYTIGDTTARFLLPGMVIAEDFESTILKPLINSFESAMKEYCADALPDEDFTFFGNENYETEAYGYVNNSDKNGWIKYLSDMKKLYERVYTNTSSAEYKYLNTFRAEIDSLLSAYTIKNPKRYSDTSKPSNQKFLEAMYEDYPITKTGAAVYVYTASSLVETKRDISNKIKKNCPDYTYSLMFEQESACGYVSEVEQKPVFRCALEYTFNSDGSLSVRLPASSIVFDESVYTVEMITPLQFFGGADMKNDGYVFYPDGSGTIVEFNDFYNDARNISIELASPIYGIDYAYSKIDSIKGISHREQVTMPVFGVVNDVKASEATKQIYGKETVRNGYFAILEEGSALATLVARSGGVSHSFMGAHAYYTPYPSDIYDLSETLSVGSLGVYKMLSKSKYTGSYVTRYVMLTDEELGNETYGENAFYASDYVGMATYYRDYLKGNGVLTALENLNEDIPLYIEVLGAMDITSKFLSFPVTETIPLTTFDNVAQIYEELSKCEEFVVNKVSEYLELAAKEENEMQKYQYEKQAERYQELVGQIQNITNINFKLTGFSNGGMSSTYPAKVKWVKACGGKSDFKKLLNTAKTASEAENANFSIYPEFDFMYINRTASFDGISNDQASVMVDNRYASKQIYNSVKQEFESFFTLVVSPDALAKLYSKFNKKYSGYDNKNISVSTLGSDLNSNFDKKNSINRDEAREMVEDVLDTMVNENGYNLMMDKGNIYAIEYATHILNAPIDSSHHRYTSYTVPFTAFILHSYVNYTGEPINYSGSPAYDMLRAIESGAALYYIVCFQNTSYMKDDENLSSYYGVDYQNWFDNIVENYIVLNTELKDLQSHEIVDHKILIAEREIEASEMQINYIKLQKEILEFLDSQLLNTVDAKLAELKGDAANYEKRIKFTVDVDALMSTFADILNLSVEELSVRPAVNEKSFAEQVAELVAEYTDYYSGAELAVNNVELKFGEFEYGTENYMTKYSYITDSTTFDSDYVYTEYTVDNGNVTMVTYQKGDSVVRFILNYNSYKVTIKLSATESYTIDAYGWKRI